MSAPHKYVSFVNFPVSENAVRSVLDAVGLELPDYAGAAPPYIELQVCGQDANADSALVLHAWHDILVTLPGSAFDIEILPEFMLRGQDGNVMAVRCRLTHLLETAIEAARLEAHRRVDTLEPSYTAFEPWILLCEGGVMPDAKNLPPSFGSFRVDKLRVSCPAKIVGGAALPHTVLNEVALSVLDE